MNIFRKEICISKEEWTDLDNYQKGLSNGSIMKKKVNIKINGKLKKYNLIIGPIIKNKIHLIKFHLENELKEEYSGEYVSTLDKLIGVKAFNIYSDGVEFSIILNIYNEFNNKLYINKDEYNIKNVMAIRKNIQRNPVNAYNEILYADFNNEKELAHASFVLLQTEKSIFIKNPILDMYLMKLEYLDYSLKDFYNPKAIYNSSDVKYILSKIKSSKEVLKYLLGYISYILFSRDKTPERRVLSLMSELAYHMYDRYVYLLKK